MVPQRDLSDALVVARPSDGSPVFLGATAAVVWRLLDDWCTADQLASSLAETYPYVAPGERASALDQILQTLEDDGLVERG